MAVKERRLLIARHAKTEPESLGVDDLDRRLTPKGRLMALQAHKWLVDSQDPLDLWWASSAVRAKNTAALLASGTDTLPEAVKIVPELYSASVFHFLSLVAAVPSDVESLCIVAHQPTVSAVVAELTGRHLSYEPGTIVAVTVPTTWQDLAPQSCKVRDVFRPTKPGDDEL